MFLTPRPINSYEETKWSFNYLRSQGFVIEVIDLEGLSDNNRTAGKLVIDPTTAPFIHHVCTYQEYEELVIKFSCSSIFVDYLVCQSNIPLKWERIFRILKKHNAKYILIYSGGLPPISTSCYGLRLGAFSFCKKLIKVSKAPNLLMEFIGQKLIIFLIKYRLIYPVPIIVFGGNSEILYKFLVDRNINTNKIILINSFDYDQSICYKRSVIGLSQGISNTCVFIDEAATHHSDFKLLGLESANEDCYYKVMNRFFDFVEMNTGLKILIAAHPRSQYTLLQKYFYGRTVIIDNTVELVAKSNLVITHASTAISYAVIFDKPIVHVTIPGMLESHPLNISVKSFANELGNDFININKEKYWSNFLNYHINTIKYATYKDRYVRTIGAAELPEWEIISNTLKKLFISA